MHRISVALSVFALVTAPMFAPSAQACDGAKKGEHAAAEHGEKDCCKGKKNKKACKLGKCRHEHHAKKAKAQTASAEAPAEQKPVVAN